MARIRTIKPSFFKHEELFDAERETGLPLRLAFAGLWTVCDREGRFEWHPRMLKTDILPYDDDVSFLRVLDALASRGFVVKYEAGGRSYGFVPSWYKHQVVNPREKASELPAPTDEAILSSKETDASSTRQHASSTLQCNSCGEQEGEQEEEGKEDSASSLCSEAGAEVAPDLRAELFGPKLASLVKASGRTTAQCRPMLGRWLRDTRDDVPRVIAAIDEAISERVADPFPWIERKIRGSPPRQRAEETCPSSIYDLLQ